MLIHAGFHEFHNLQHTGGGISYIPVNTCLPFIQHATPAKIVLCLAKLEFLRKEESLTRGFLCKRGHALIFVQPSSIGSRKSLTAKTFGAVTYCNIIYQVSCFWVSCALSATLPNAEPRGGSMHRVNN